MKKYFEGAYWFYTVAISFNIFISIVVILNYDEKNFTITLPILGSVDIIPWSLSIISLMMAVAHFYALPLLARHYNENLGISARAAELEAAAVTDHLTGLYNRRYFEDALREYLSAFKGIEAPVALFILDIDKFKKVNDTYGHDVGDYVLRKISDELKQMIREHDVVARLGGEEFCIIAPFHEHEDIVPFAERICSRIANMQLQVTGGVIAPTVSIGVSVTSDGFEDIDTLLKEADLQLYKAKRAGRNRVCYKNL